MAVGHCLRQRTQCRGQTPGFIWSSLYSLLHFSSLFPWWGSPPRCRPLLRTRGKAGCRLQVGSLGLGQNSPGWSMAYLLTKGALRSPSEPCCQPSSRSWPPWHAALPGLLRPLAPGDTQRVLGDLGVPPGCTLRRHLLWGWRSSTGLRGATLPPSSGAVAGAALSLPTWSGPSRSVWSLPHLHWAPALCLSVLCPLGRLGFQVSLILAIHFLV